MSHAAPTTTARESGLTTPIGVGLHALVRRLDCEYYGLPTACREPAAYRIHGSEVSFNACKPCAQNFIKHSNSKVTKL